MQAVAHATSFTDDTLCGIELDLDAVAGVLSSAQSKVGISPVQARQYVQYAAADTKAAYLHISEGAVQLTNGEKDAGTGKLISYLVSDFIKGQMIY